MCIIAGFFYYHPPLHTTRYMPPISACMQRDYFLEFTYMADVQPFRGLRYAREKVSDLAQIITPPFDVISKEAQARYYERHPYNIVRLEPGRQGPTDDTLNNVYTRAAVTLSEWRLQHILYQEALPCYY